MKFSKCLVFGLSTLCGIVTTIPYITTITEASSENKKMQKAYKDFIEETISVAKKSGIVDLTGINFGILNKSVIESIYDSLSEAYDEIKKSKDGEPIVLIDKQDESKNKSLCSKFKSDNEKWKISMVDESYSAPIVQAFMDSKLNNTIEVASCLPDIEPVIFELLEAKMARLAVNKISKKPLQLIINETRMGKSSKKKGKTTVVVNSTEVGKKYANKIKEIAKKYGFKVENASELSGLIGLAIDQAYVSNIIDLRFLVAPNKDSIEKGDYIILKNHLKEFENNCVFGEKPVKVLVFKENEWYDMIKKDIGENEKFEIREGIYASVDYYNYVDIISTIADSTGVVNITGTLSLLLPERSVEISDYIIDEIKKIRYSGNIISDSDDKPLHTILYHTDEMERCYEWIRPRCFINSKAEDGIKYALGEFSDKSILLKNKWFDSIGTGLYMAGWLSKQVNFGCKSKYLIMPKVAGEALGGYFILSMAMIMGLQKDMVPELTLCGRFDKKTKKLVEACEFPYKDSSDDSELDENINEIVAATYNTYTTGVFDLSNVDIGKCQEKGIGKFISAYVNKVITSENPKKNITVLVGLSDAYKKEGGAVVKELKKIGDKNENVKIATIQL